MTRPTRIVLGVVIGLLSVGFGVISHGLHVVNSGPDWADVTGVGIAYEQRTKKFFDRALGLKETS